MTEPARRTHEQPDDTDGALARRIADARGAEDAEAELCRRLMPRIHLFGLRHLRDRHTAEELTQHVMTITLQKLRAGDVEQPEGIASFVLGVARNAVRELGRSEARWRRHAPLDPLVAAAEVDGPDPLDVEQLRRCLGELAERERSVVVLTFFDRQEAPGIAARLGLTAGNVRVIRMRALNRLRDCITAGAEAAS